MEYKLYYEGRVIEHKYSNEIGDIIIHKFKLKKGSIFNLYPEDYSYFYKDYGQEKRLEYHTTLEIKDIRYSITEDSQYTMSLIEIFLTEAVEEDY